MSPLSPGTPSSPPGYPNAIYTPVYDALHDQPVTLSPYSTNLSAFKQTFGQADRKVDTKDEIVYLQEVIDVAGMVDPDLPNLFHCSDGAMYESGHGRAKCKPEMCVNPDEPPEAIPSNCGYCLLYTSPSPRD